jgi:hypothetical protein
MPGKSEPKQLHVTCFCTACEEIRLLAQALARLEGWMLSSRQRSRWVKYIDPPIADGREMARWTRIKGCVLWSRRQGINAPRRRPRRAR